jgi:PAS domain S-box-containing protein
LKPFRAPFTSWIFGERKIVFVNRDIASEKDVQDPEFIRSILLPYDWQPFLDHIERLAKLGDRETADFEYKTRYEGVWRWFHSRHRVFRRDEDGSVREIVGTATDATERKAAEERASFMADLNQAMHPLTDPVEIMGVAVRMLGEYLGVDRCGYAEVERDKDHFVVLGNYTRGSAASIVGRFRMSDLGNREREVLLQNQPYVVNDIVAESPPGTDLSPYELDSIRSMVCVPLNKEGNFVARMAVQQSTPRNWTKGEIDLLTKVANRCWEVVESARAVRQLKNSDDRYRAFIANSSEAIWRYELEQPIPLALSVDEQIEMLLKHAYLAECNDAMARMYGYETADQIVGARLGDLLVFDDPQNIALLRAFKESNYSLTDFESREVDRYGNTKYFMNNLTAVRENGVLVRGWGTQRDVTEQKRAAEALRASEERLRRISTATQDALWEMDLKTNQLWWSEGARPLFGRSPRNWRSDSRIGMRASIRKMWFESRRSSNASCATTAITGLTNTGSAGPTALTSTSTTRAVNSATNAEG